MKEIFLTYWLLGLTISYCLLRMTKKFASFDNALAKILTVIIISLCWGIILPLAIYFVRKGVDKNEKL